MAALPVLFQFYLSMPPVTRVYSTACVLTTLAVHLELITPFQLYFNPYLIFQKFQVWRLVTTFLFFGSFGFNFMFNIIFTYRYCSMLEEGSFRTRTADFFYMFLIGGLLMNLLGFFVNLLFLGHAFTIMLVYIWSRQNEHVLMNFFGLFNFQAPYLPWVLFGFSFILGNSVIIDLIGIAVGHIYYYLENVCPARFGFRLLKTPRFIIIKENLYCSKMTNSDKWNWPVVWSTFIRLWRLVLGFLTPIVLVPFLLDFDDKPRLCAYVLILMVVFWMFEPINLYMTALIPVALFPLLGIASTDDTCIRYMKGTNMMFFGGLIMGIALEHSNLHRRVALKVIVLFGSSVKNLMAGIMLVTMFLSMWISNTATTSMMLPIKTLRKALMLSIAYSANIGGTATLTGTGTNLVLQEVFHDTFPSSTSLTFTSWFIYAFPSALITVVAAWLLLFLFFLRNHKETKESGEQIRKASQLKYEELGNLTFHEIAVTIHFVILVLLWFFRQPGIYPGWADLLSNDKSFIKDATPAILISISMFLVPARLDQIFGKKPDAPNGIDRLLNWKVLQTHISWGVILLLGGGFALAFGVKESKLSDVFSDKLQHIEMQPVIMTFVLILIGASVTEMASNVATANVILPVICQLAVHMEVNPLLYIVPTTIGISFAFMFPVATPPNAIVFEYLKMSVIEMVKPGIFMNLVAILIQLAFINTLGRVLFNLNEFPEWATINSTSLVTRMNAAH
ncbi:hypothetical protein BLOT_003798 [Blomia tropicalis]|nr:hypothetical protein BLOT_003798 [Blomia tropicalis]